MNKQELIMKLNNKVEEEDYEMAHVHADNLLLEFINDYEIKKAFDSLCKGYA